MQTHHHRPSPRRRVAVRATLVAAVATTTFLAVAPSAEAARPTTESEVVAESAERALAALERWQESNRPAHYVRYVRARERTAELLADEVGVSGAALASDWEVADDRQQIAVLSALTQLGVPYRRFASQPEVGFDCSGLTGWAWAEAGVELPRSSGTQIRAADEVDDTEAEAGFLVYYPGHISMYVGQGFMVHAPFTGSRVEVVPVSERTRAIGDPITADVLDELEGAGQPTELF